MRPLVLLLLLTSGANAQSTCGSYFDVQKAANAVQAACGTTLGSGFPPACSAPCAAAFNAWYQAGHGACFLAMKLPPNVQGQFGAFGKKCALVGGGAAAGPSLPICAGRTVEDRFVLVDKPMSWNNARAYCQSRYLELASVHSHAEQQLAIQKCAQRSKRNACTDRWVNTRTCCAKAGCQPANNAQSDGSNGCWIGLHQPFGHGEREVVAFDNRAQCNVDQRLPGHLLDLEISKLRVQTVDGQQHTFNMEAGYFLGKDAGCSYGSHPCVCRLRCPKGMSRTGNGATCASPDGKKRCDLSWCHQHSSKLPRCKSPEVTLRSLLLGDWHGVSTENDLYKVIAGTDPSPTKNLYMFDDGDAGNYVSTKPGSDMCAKGEFPCCQDPSKRGISSFGKGTYSLCKGCARGQTRQSNCPGTPYGLLSMGPPTGSRVVGKEKGVPSGDLGECSYRTDWGWVVRAMWVTPASAAGGQSSTFVWSDGSAVDYSAWFAGNLPARTNEDEVELRMGCDSWACFHGSWNDNTNAWARPFLCESKAPKYKLVDIDMSWQDARQYCRAKGYGDLASIHSELDQEDALAACARRTGANPCVDRYKDKMLGVTTPAGQHTCKGSVGCWIGLHEPAAEGHMVWSDGSSVDYSAWFPGQPSDSGGVQDEVELRMGCDWYGCFRGKWNDNNGGTGTNGQKGAVKQPFLCQGNPRQGGGH